MTAAPRPTDPYAAPGQPGVDQVRLWAGGLVTAVVVALLTLVIWWVVRDVLDVPSVHVMGERSFATDAAIDDAIAVFVATLVATMLLDVLLLLAPTPLRFFGWLVGLVTVVLALAPWTADGDVEPRLPGPSARPSWA